MRFYSDRKSLEIVNASLQLWVISRYEFHQLFGKVLVCDAMGFRVPDLRVMTWLPHTTSTRSISNNQTDPELRILHENSESDHNRKLARYCWRCANSDLSNKMPEILPRANQRLEAPLLTGSSPHSLDLLLSHWAASRPLSLLPSHLIRNPSHLSCFAGPLRLHAHPLPSGANTTDLSRDFVSFSHHFVSFSHQQLHYYISTSTTWVK